MEPFLKELIASGPIGIMLALMVYDNFKMKAKLFSVIENNTKALTELTEAHKERRKQYAN